MIKSLLLFVLLVANPECIIPKVSSYSVEKGCFNFESGCTYYVEGQVASSDEVSVFKNYIETCPLSLVEVKGPARKAQVRFRIGAKELKGRPSGAYSLTVSSKGINISSADVAGAFYAVQSLMQMRDSENGPSIAACRIDDEPRYQHRGLMFDLVRHFQSKEFVFRQLDVMALLKFNVLHLHLTDNEGWRIELDCAPELVREGAFGNSDYYNDPRSKRVLKFSSVPAGYQTGTVYDDGRVCGGYYTKDEIREIINYAAERHIEVIPEIELPGHNKALLHVHPEFFCDGEHGVDNVVCPANEKVYAFFEKVLAEVMELFPSPSMHIGGDEADKRNWILCSRCKEKMASEDLKNELELQSYMIRRMDKFVTSHGKRIIGWDEILEGGLSENATVMSWRGTKGGIKALRMGHDVIMSPNTYYYLDYGQDATYKEPFAFNSYLPLKTVYDYDPEQEIVASYGEDCSISTLAHLLGVQGNMWGECVITPEHFEYMMYPRAYAIAETAWSPAGSKDYDSFRERALAFNVWMNNHGYHTFDLAGEVGERPETWTEFPRITKEATVMFKAGKKAPKKAPVLVDGLLGGWKQKGAKYWMESSWADVTIDVDLGSVKDIHYLGAEFMDYLHLEYAVPEDTEFFVSVDGKEYVPVRIPQIRLKPGRKDYGIFTVGSPVAVSARYIRLRYNKEAKFRTSISEVIVN